MSRQNCPKDVFLQSKKKDAFVHHEHVGTHIQDRRREAILHQKTSPTRQRTFKVSKMIPSRTSSTRTYACMRTSLAVSLFFIHPSCGAPVDGRRKKREEGRRRHKKERRQKQRDVVSFACSSECGGSPSIQIWRDSTTCLLPRPKKKKPQRKSQRRKGGGGGECTFPPATCTIRNPRLSPSFSQIKLYFCCYMYAGFRETRADSSLSVCLFSPHRQRLWQRDFSSKADCFVVFCCGVRAPTYLYVMSTAAKRPLSLSLSRPAVSHPSLPISRVPATPLSLFPSRSIVSEEQCHGTQLIMSRGSTVDVYRHTRERGKDWVKMKEDQRESPKTFEREVKSPSPSTAHTGRQGRSTRNSQALLRALLRLLSRLFRQDFLSPHNRSPNRVDSSSPSAALRSITDDYNRVYLGMHVCINL